MPVDPEIYAWIVELYAYSATIGPILTCYAEKDMSALPLDALTQLDSMNPDFRLRGFMFGSTQNLFRLIHRLSQNVARWISDGAIERDALDFDEFQQLETAIEASVPGDDVSGQCLWASTMEARDSHLAARMHQQSFLLLLYVAFHGSQPPDDDLLARIQPFVDEYFKLDEELSFYSPARGNTLWTMILMGSCTRDPRQRHLIEACLTDPLCCMGAFMVGLDVLRALWNSGSALAFGIVGLAGVLRTQNRTFFLV